MGLVQEPFEIFQHGLKCWKEVETRKKDSLVNFSLKKNHRYRECYLSPIRLRRLIIPFYYYEYSPFIASSVHKFRIISDSLPNNVLVLFNTPIFSTEFRFLYSIGQKRFDTPESVYEKILRFKYLFAVQEFYLTLRKQRQGSDCTPITTRQLEAMLRLTEVRL